MSELPPFDEADLARLLADESVWLDPPSSLERRVLDAVERVQGAEVVDLSAERRRRGRSLQRAAPWFVAAAGVAAAIVIALHPGGSTPPHQFEASLTGTPLARGASASASFENKASGVEIRVRISGLGRAPEGSFYEAWVKGDHGLVPVGTFHTGGRVTLWSGVDVREFPTMTVTLEPDDGNPASSGRKVLTGTIHPG